MKTDFAVAILAAGLGTRMKSRHAKVLHRAGGQTLIELVTAAATRLVPSERVHIVVGYQADLVKQAAESYGVKFLLQNEQLGTGHAVCIGREALSGVPNLLVLYGDCPLVAAETLQALMERHLESKAAATVLTTRLEDPAGYGRMIRSSSGEIEAIVEEKAATAEQQAITEINSGIYCFQTSSLFDCLDRVRPDNAAGEYYLTDVIACLVTRGRRVDGSFTAESSQVLGVNTRAELAEVDRVLRSRKVQKLMLEGVTIERPETVVVDAGVIIAPDTVLEPFVQVLGRSS